MGGIYGCGWRALLAEGGCGYKDYRHKMYYLIKIFLHNKINIVYYIRVYMYKVITVVITSN